MLSCEECGSWVFEIETPLRDGATIRCGECGSDCGRYPAFFSNVVAREESTETQAERVAPEAAVQTQ